MIGRRASLHSPRSGTPATTAARCPSDLHLLSLAVERVPHDPVIITQLP